MQSKKDNRERKGFIESKECAMCKQQRQSKALVAADMKDNRFRGEAFVGSPAIFANNDLKYEADRVRAKFYAVAHEQALTYCPAKDKVTGDQIYQRRN